MRLAALSIVVASFTQFCASVLAQTQPASAPATQPPSKLLAWHQTLEEGQDESRRLWQPILLYVGATWCEPCRQFEKEIEQSIVQDKLATWVRVYIDADRWPLVVRSLGIGTLPALRIMTPAGRAVASDNGLLSAGELIQWLDAHRNKAIAGVSEELTDTRPPDPAMIERIMRQLVGDDPLAREAAVRRLLPHANLAAARVVQAFSTPTLSTRLAALELLEEWNAPIDEIDPWQPDSITPQKIARLQEWAAAIVVAPAATATTQSSVAAEVVRQDLRQLLESSGEAEAQVLRERLARVGEPLLPEIHDWLSIVSTDLQRERLMALRYRIVASDRLALGWPGGLERLASSNASVRHGALDELSARATARDHRLLVELFGDPDSFMRERALKLLRQVGGREPTQALVTLLNDREPNVRAAVLKQLAEAPDVSLIDQVVQYINNESDPDLLVHAVRVLRVTPAPAAIDALGVLMSHSNWRVRAEAIEAIHERAGRWPQAQNAALYAKLIRLLEDEDGFVASRAVLALSELKLTSAAEPLVRAAARHPELAPDVLKLLSTDPRMALAALPQVKEFATDEDPVVRGAAVRAITLIVPQSCSPYLRAGLRDAEPSVRIAAAAAILELLEKQRPGGDRPASYLSKNRRSDTSRWLDEFRAGHGRPHWADELLDDLRAMLRSQDPDEALAAGLALVAIAREDEALPILLERAHADESRRSALAQTLPWLPWEKRLAVFDQLLKLKLSDEQLALAISSLATISDPRAAEPLWNLLADDSTPNVIVSAVHSALQRLYLGERYYDTADLSFEAREAIVAATRSQLQQGRELQKSVALALMLMGSRENAAEAASGIVADSSQPAPLRSDALQILLLSQPSVQAQKTAVEHLADPQLRAVALPYLVEDTQRMLRYRHDIYLYLSDVSLSVRATTSGQPTPISAPQGVSSDSLLAILEAADSDAESRAYAGYLLALLGDRRGWDALHEHWKSHKDSTWNRLVYRAIAAMNADELTPVLEEIYRSLEKDAWEMREFYWTIRSMKGGNILHLRKMIRDQVGMERLR